MNAPLSPESLRALRGNGPAGLDGPAGPDGPDGIDGRGRIEGIDGIDPASGQAPPPAGAGRVVLVGAGPGDVELLTLKAARLIAAADWLVHDALVHPDVLALATRARRVPVGKRAGRRSAAQADINAILIDLARRGGLVVRLKGGDPLMFARAQEELDALAAAGIAAEVVPGITTAQAAFAALRAPMTERGRRRSVVFATPQVQASERGTAAAASAPPDVQWARALVNAGGGALYMAASAAARVRATLLSLGLPASMPVTWLVDVSLPTQSVIGTTLGALQSLPEGLAGRPALLLVGTAATSPWTQPVARTEGQRRARSHGMAAGSYLLAD